MYNLIFYVIEDDNKMNSSFFHDLTHLLQKNYTVPIHIIYHSKSFYGSYFITINKEDMVFKKIKDLDRIDEKSIRKEIKALYSEYYNPNYKNIVYYGGHSKWLFKDQETMLSECHVFDDLFDVELLILDSCYTSYSQILNHIIDKVNFVMCCQTASPNVGFLNSDFISILMNKKVNPIDRYILCIDSFIQRNEPTNEKYKGLHYRTDGVLIDMKKYKKLNQYLSSKDIDVKRKSSCRIESLKDYYFYDLWCSSGDKKIKNLVEKCVLYQKLNTLAQTFFDKHSKDFHGLSIHI